MNNRLNMPQVFAVAAGTLIAVLCLPASCQQSGNLVNAGQTSLPAGQYVITNVTTGQALYGVVAPGGQLFVQDPRVLQISVSAAPPVLNQQGAFPGQPAAPGQQPGAQPQQGSMWGGLLKQGFNSLMKNQMAPAGQQ